MQKLSLAALGAALATPVLAHPGHPEAIMGAGHWLTEIDHRAVIVVTVVVVALTFAAARWARRD